MTSTLSLLQSTLKPKSSQQRCWVFYESGEKVRKYELPIDDLTTVQNIIITTIDMIKNELEGITKILQKGCCSLYASRKNGKQINDLPSFEAKQMVSKTGMKFFVLRLPQPQEEKVRTSTVSTRSIQSSMKNPSRNMEK